MQSTKFALVINLKSAKARSLRPRGHRSRHRRPPPHSAHADARLRGDARGRDGGIREELAAGVRHVGFWRYSGSGPVCRPDPVGRKD